ncbi:MAG: hypothetical protein ACT4P4_07430 [Betaproteobacteria bacterium]
MDKLKALLERQARWQRARRGLSWAEKIRMAEAVRESAARWNARDGRPNSPPRRR